MSAFFACNTATRTEENTNHEVGAFKKAPLQFDSTQLLYPPNHDRNSGTTLPKRATTYYTFPANTTNILTDCNDAINYFTCNSSRFFEATYSQRFQSNPNDLWIKNGTWLQAGAGVLLHNEQAEAHFFYTGSPGYTFLVTISFEVSSEQGWDYLWITSSSDSPNCNSPGVVRHKTSGIQAGQLSFYMHSGCSETGWLGVYYIKDGSVNANGDYARIKNVAISQVAGI